MATARSTELNEKQLDEFKQLTAGAPASKNSHAIHATRSLGSHNGHADSGPGIIALENYFGLPPTGVFSDSLKQKVIDLQKRAGFAEKDCDGITGKATFAVMCNPEKFGLTDKAFDASQMPAHRAAWNEMSPPKAEAVHKTTETAERKTETVHKEKTSSRPSIVGKVFEFGPNGLTVDGKHVDDAKWKPIRKAIPVEDSPQPDASQPSLAAQPPAAQNQLLKLRPMDQVQLAGESRPGGGRFPYAPPVAPVNPFNVTTTGSADYSASGSGSGHFQSARFTAGPTRTRKMKNGDSIIDSAYLIGDLNSSGGRVTGDAGAGVSRSWAQNQRSMRTASLEATESFGAGRPSTTVTGAYQYSSLDGNNQPVNSIGGYVSESNIGGQGRPITSAGMMFTHYFGDHPSKEDVNAKAQAEHNRQMAEYNKQMAAYNRAVKAENDRKAAEYQQATKQHEAELKAYNQSIKDWCNCPAVKPEYDRWKELMGGKDLRPASIDMKVFEALKAFHDKPQNEQDYCNSPAIKPHFEQWIKCTGGQNVGPGTGDKNVVKVFQAIMNEMPLSPKEVDADGKLVKKELLSVDGATGGEHSHTINAIKTFQAAQYAEGGVANKPSGVIDFTTFLMFQEAHGIEARWPQLMDDITHNRPPSPPPAPVLAPLPETAPATQPAGTPNTEATPATQPAATPTDPIPADPAKAGASATSIGKDANLTALVQASCVDVNPLSNKTPSIRPLPGAPGRMLT